MMQPEQVSSTASSLPPLEERLKSPSLKDGMSVQDILLMNQQASRYMRKLAKKLDLALIPFCTAQVFYHRFYSRMSAKVHDKFIVCTTCIFLAAKVEESFIYLDTVTREAMNLLKDSNQLTSSGALDLDDAAGLKERVLLCERILLHTLSFDIMVEHSHSYVDRLTSALASSHVVELKNTCISILNDSLTSNICLRHHPRIIAAAAICLAVKFLKYKNKAQPVTTSRLVDNLQNMYKQDSIFQFKASQIEPVEEELLALYENVLILGAKFEHLEDGNVISKSSGAATPPLVVRSGDTNEALNNSNSNNNNKEGEENNNKKTKLSLD